jgi:hypothetical protein
MEVKADSDTKTEIYNKMRAQIKIMEHAYIAMRETITVYKERRYALLETEKEFYDLMGRWRVQALLTPANPKLGEQVVIQCTHPSLQNEISLRAIHTTHGFVFHAVDLAQAVAAFRTITARPLPEDLFKPGLF